MSEVLQVVMDNNVDIANNAVNVYFVR